MKDKKTHIFALSSSDGEEIDRKLAELDTDNLPDDFSLRLPVAIFRTGRFFHPVYGELNITQEYLDNIIRNFDNTVMMRDVSFDKGHRKFDDRAIAWVKEVYTKPKVIETAEGEKAVTVLYADAEFNRLGVQLLKRKEYRYFSSEIHPNYTTFEVQKTQTAKGEAEFIPEYGPTLMGGGLVNNPFIPGLGPVVFSEDGAKVSVEDGDDVPVVLNDDNSGIILFCAEYKDQEENTEPLQENEEQEEDINEPESEQVQDFENTNKTDLENTSNIGEEQMEFGEIVEGLSQFSSLDEQVDYLMKCKMDFSGPSEVLEALIESKRAAADAKREADDAISKKVALEKEREELRQKTVTLSNDLREAREGAYHSRVEAFCAELETEGHVPAVVNTVKEILRSSPSDARTKAFSLSADAEEASADIMQVIKTVLDKVPENGRVDESEQFDANAEAEVDQSNDETEVTPDPQSFDDDNDTEPQENEVPVGVQKYADNEQGGTLPPKFMWDNIDENGVMHWNKVNE